MIGPRRPAHLALLVEFGKDRRLFDLAANDVARDDDGKAQPEPNAHALHIELLRRHARRERQEDSSRKALPALHALQSEAREDASSTERCMFPNHRTGSGDFTGYRETLEIRS